jgi:peptide/nickel transport system permease protein
MVGVVPIVSAMRAAAPSARFGLVVIASYVAVAVLAPVIAPFGERQVVGAEFAPWSRTHLLGTDNLGRDMLTRLIYGARNMLAIASATTLLAFVAGGVLGLVASTVGGLVDRVLAWAVDLVMATPSLILSLLLLTIFGSSIPVMVLVIAAIESARVFRLARAVALGIVAMDYVDAARLRGEGLAWLVLREVLPNAAPPLIAEFGLRFCFVFLFIAALSFLGLGIQPPTAEWGSMVRDNASLITFGDVTPLLPAGAIALLTVAVNFVVDWVLHRASGLKD